MTDLQTLFREVDGLSAAELRQLYEYIVKNRIKFLDGEESPTLPETRIPNLFPGIWTSDDFDDELPDSFWLGEE